MPRKILDFIKKQKVTLVVLVALIIGGVVVFKTGGKDDVEAVSVATGDLVRTVKISGKVIPKESANLSFEISGIVSNVLKDTGDEVRRGDVIANINSSAISADIARAEAELALAQAELKKLNGADAFEAQITNSKQALIQTIKDAYADAEDAVYNKTDQFFLDPDSDRPIIAPDFQDNQNLRNDINTRRVAVGNILNSWKSIINNLNLVTYTEKSLSDSKEYLGQISQYIAVVSRAVSLFEASNAFSQTVIDGYKTDTVTARNNLNTASQDLISAEKALRNLMLDVPVQIARVESASATLTNYRSQLSKTVLVSPISGIISKQDSKVGEIVSAASNIASVISRELEIESYIPEILISGVKIGNPATVTLDAYSDQDIFEAKVVRIDPAETIRDGVSTYKVRLAFSAPDERIRSGMTANIKIETLRKSMVRLIPEHAIFKDGEETFVYLLGSDESETKTSVVVGERDSSGNVELLSDLPSDSKLITNPNDK